MDLKSFLKSLHFLHLSLVMGLTVFFIIALIQNNTFNTDIEENKLLLFLVPITSLLGYFGSKFIFKRRIKELQTTDSLTFKLEKYQTAAHIQYMLIEIPAFIALYVYTVTGNALPLVITGCLLCYLFAQKPSISNIKKCLPFNTKDFKAMSELD